MNDNKKILAVIPARGGSKGVPRKNIRPLAGKPLIVWTIEAAKKSKYISSLILSSDDEEIMAVAKKHGCDVPFKRPPQLAQDKTPGVDVVLHAAEQVPGYEYVLLLQPTSPLRTSEDIDACIEQAFKDNLVSCVSVCEAEKSPYWMFQLGEGNKLNPILNIERPAATRQELPKIYAINGALYLIKTDLLRKEKTLFLPETTGYIMPAERSLDIDTEFDFSLCESVLKRR